MGHHLNAADTLSIQGWVERLGVARGSVMRVDPAGDGNMNLTLRVTMTEGSVVLKQSRPWVEKYPQFAAPEDRALTEAAFYRAIADTAVAHRMPRLLAVDAGARLLAFEDLGPSRDYTDLYDGHLLKKQELTLLLEWLRSLHQLQVPFDETLANRSMRALNHAHIFEIPFRRNDLDLDGVCEGLQALVETVRQDAKLQARIADAGALYLQDGPCLLHGDFYPGSFLRTPDGPMVIDPEFTFLGDPAFDRGVLAGHLVLAGQQQAIVQRALLGAPEGTLRFGGVEILRRLFGVAQLPLKAGLVERRAMVDIACDWIRA